jgi:O-antigen/teichoic acid export membrane protein
MTAVRTLVRQSSHYLAGTAITIVMGFVSFPVFTRVFTVADYGTVDLIQRLVLLATAFGKLGVQNAVLRFYDVSQFQKDLASARRYVSSAVLGASGSAVVVALMTGVAFHLASPGGTVPPFMAVMAGGLALFRILQSIFMNLLRVEQKTKAYMAAQIGTRAATIALILLLFAVREKGIRSFFEGSLVVEAAIVVVLACALVRRKLLASSGFDWRFYRSMVVFGLPLIAYECMCIALESVDRFLIRSFLGAEPLGYYSAAYALCIYIQDLLLVPINMALVPLYLRLWSDEGRERTAEFLSRSLRIFIVVALGFFAGVIVCSRDALMILASSKYEASTVLIPWIVAGLFLYVTNAFFNAALLIHKRTLDMAKLALAAFVLKVVANLWLIPRIGLYGAVAATVTAYAFLLVLTARLSLPLLPLRTDWAALARGGVCAFVAVTAAIWVNLDSHLLNFLARGTIAVAVYTTCMYAVDGDVRLYLGQAAADLRKAVQALGTRGAQLVQGLW